MMSDIYKRQEALGHRRILHFALVTARQDIALARDAAKRAVRHPGENDEVIDRLIEATKRINFALDTTVPSSGDLSGGVS
jgi:adenosine/AMP kinase